MILSVMARAKAVSATAVATTPPSPKAEQLGKVSITAKTLPKYLMRAMTAYAPEIVPQCLEAIRKGAINNDKDFARMGLEVFGLLAAKNGVIINNNNNNIANSSSGATRSFDELVRRYSSERRESEPIDITPVEE